MFSELTYDLRSGEPDSLDQMVAITFANVAMDLIADGVRGRMVAIRDGKYAHSPLPDPALGARHVDVDVDVQRRALPAALRGPAWTPDAAGGTGPDGRLTGPDAGEPARVGMDRELRR